MVHLEKQVVEIAPDMTSILENGTEIMETPGVHYKDSFPELTLKCHHSGHPAVCGPKLREARGSFSEQKNRESRSSSLSTLLLPLEPSGQDSCLFTRVCQLSTFSRVLERSPARAPSKKKN
ncbi:uncharacterized [Tachysurus ichikawai]